MKRIVCSILINALLLQAGCYSESLISKGNLRTESNDIRIITTNKREYKIKPGDWVTRNDTIIVYPQINSNDKQATEEQKIPYNSIDKIYINQFDWGITATLIFGVAIFVIGFIISLNNIGFNGFN